jgi:2-haloacid dehalogenase
VCGGVITVCLAQGITMRLSDFSLLSFDCYGPLIDWGIFAALQPLIAKGKVTLDRDKALEIFGRHEAAQEKETRGRRYSEFLAEVHRRLAEEWGVAATDQEHRKFGHSVPDWPTFPDTPEALAYSSSTTSSSSSERRPREL